MEINETNEIRELYRMIGETPETEEKDMKSKQEVAKEWAEMKETFEVNSADRLINYRLGASK